jgi:hypothetical protein
MGCEKLEICSKMKPQMKLENKTFVTIDLPKTSQYHSTVCDPSIPMKGFNSAPQNKFNFG